MKNETITKLQSKIEEKYPLKTLHILNGLCMLDSFQKGDLMSEKAVYVLPDELHYNSFVFGANSF